MWIEHYFCDGFGDPDITRISYPIPPIVCTCAGRRCQRPVRAKCVGCGQQARDECRGDGLGFDLERPSGEIFVIVEMQITIVGQLMHEMRANNSLLNSVESDSIRNVA